MSIQLTTANNKPKQQLRVNTSLLLQQSRHKKTHLQLSNLKNLLDDISGAKNTLLNVSGGDIGALVLIKDIKNKLLNISGNYSNKLSYLNKVSDELELKQSVVNVNRAKLEVFNLSGHVKSLENKLSVVNYAKEKTINELTTNELDITVNIIKKQLEIDYINASGEYGVVTNNLNIYH